jgi:insertion element IS1 protein InsB
VIENINREYLEQMDDASGVAVELISYHEIAGELDEMWSFVGNKGNQRWLWLAIHHETRVVLAYAFGTRTDDVFRELKSLLKPFGITIFFTDDWGAYERNLPAHAHFVGKSNTQRIERKNLTLRTRVKRLARRTICFSKSVRLHDIVIGLAINFIEFSYFHLLLQKLF